MKTTITYSTRQVASLLMCVFLALSAFGEYQARYAIVSVGVVQGRTKVVTLSGLMRKTWARFALWSNDNRGIYFKAGEKFYGHVHSNTELYFSGDPEFFSDCTSAASAYGGNTNSCVFHEGLRLNAGTDSMADVSFPELRMKANLIVTGETTIVFSGTNIVMTNSRKGWTSVTNGVSTNALIYVDTATTGPNKPGDVNISGTLDGRVTIVSARDINITDHIRYVDDPKTNSASDDALGFISNRDIVVKPSCPDDIEIYAHMMATGNLTSEADPAHPGDGSFGVENYYSGSPRGTLNIHGGIVQDRRGAVGTFSIASGMMVTGYDKNYTYDTRFAIDPPPHYPPLSNELEFGSWRDK